MIGIRWFFLLVGEETSILISELVAVRSEKQTTNKKVQLIWRLGE